MSRIIFSRLNLALAAAIACVTIAGFWFLPANQQLPLHWNWHGDVDSRGPRELALLLLPAAAFAITIFFWILDRFVLKLDESHGGRQFALGLSGTLAVFFVLQLTIIRHGLGYPVAVSRAIAFVAALVFIVIGNVLPKMQPTARRLSWPKSLDASRHRRIQRLTGIIMMLSGFGLLSASVFDLPPPWLNAGTVIAALLPAAAGIGYALVLSSARASNG
jgi:immunity protein, SdpI family